MSSTTRAPLLEKTPFPGVPQDDLTSVLENLTEVYSRGKGRTARDPNETATRWLLEAGVRALASEFLSYKDSQDSDKMGYGNANALLGSVSLEQVMEHLRELADEIGVDPGAGSRDRISRRWRTFAGYQRDLLRYVFRPSVDSERINGLRQQLPLSYDHSTFGQLVLEVARSEVDLPATSVVHGLRLPLQGAFPNDPLIRELCEVLYKHLFAEFGALYETIGAAYGITPEIIAPWTFTDMAKMFSSLVEGSSLTTMIDPALATLSDGSHAAVQMIQMLLSQMTSTPWHELSERRAFGGLDHNH